MIKKLELGSILVILALLAGPAPVKAHARLDHAAPAAGSTVSSSPSEITLYFTEELGPKFSGAEVRSMGGARVDHGATISGKVMRLSVRTLQPGNHTVTWHVTSVDTHKTQGSFSFTVGK
jgi:copper resistance protein C